MRMHLYQLTNGFQITGFMRVPIFVKANEGVTLKLYIECYIVLGMTSPLLLGEDFQVNYKIGVTRSISIDSTLQVGQTGYSIPTSSSPTHDLRAFDIFRKGVEARFVRSKMHHRKKNCHHPELKAASDPFIQAACNLHIPAHLIGMVPTNLKFTVSELWLVEKTILGQSDGSFLLTTPCLLNASSSRVPVFNPNSHPYLVKMGDVLSRCLNPEDTLDSPSEELQKHAAAIQTYVHGMHLHHEGTPPPAELNSSSDQNEQWGPKTAETVDPTIYPSSQLEQILDIGPDWPAEGRVKLLEVLHRHQNAFGFDGRLGHNADELFKINLQLGQCSISVSMYSASPAKCDIINQQIDAWLSLEVIEPSRSPWGAPVVILY